MQSPESIFGHIFLVFYNEEFPNFSSVVISYVANTENMSKGTEYLYNGIFSKFKSVIVIDNFSQIFFKYHLEQRRELFFYELSVDQYEVDNMYESLSKNKYILNNYNFFTNNCVNGIDFVLKYFLNDENTPKESVFYTPFEFLEDYRKIIRRSFILSVNKIDASEENIKINKEFIDFYSKKKSDVDLVEVNKNRSEAIPLIFYNSEISNFLNKRVSFVKMINEKNDFFEFNFFQKNYSDYTIDNKSFHEISFFDLTFENKQYGNLLRKIGIIDINSYSGDDTNKKNNLNFRSELIYSNNIFYHRGLVDFNTSVLLLEDYYIYPSLIIPFDNSFKLTEGFSLKYFYLKKVNFKVKIELYFNFKKQSEYFFEIVTPHEKNIQSIFGVSYFDKIFFSYKLSLKF